MNSKRKDLTLKEKINVLEYASVNKCTQLELAKRFEISQAQVSKLLKNKEKILDAIKCNANLNLKRKRSGKESVIEEALLRWFQEIKTLHIPVSGVMLSQKAEDIARELNITNFKATNGWLCRWKKRNQISSRITHSDTSDAEVDMTNKSSNNILPDLSKNCFTNFSVDNINPEEVSNDNKSPPEGIKEKTFSEFLNFKNYWEVNGEVSNCSEFSKREIEEDDDDSDSDEIISMKNKTPSSDEVINACNTIRHFLETKPNVDLNLFYKLENQITNLLEREHSKLLNFFNKKFLALSAQTKNFKYPYTVPARVQREELQVVAEALGSLRRCFPANDARQHTLDTVEQSLAALLERINALEMTSPSTLISSPLLRRSNNEKEAPHSLPILHHGETSDNYQEDFGGTKVVYYMDKSLTPFRCSLHKRIGEATLRDFKLLFDRPGQFRYHFKTLDPEFGMVKEEVLNDDDILPGWDSKIVAWIEEECS